MGDKRKQKRTTKKTNWENIRSWVGAVLCIAVIVAVASYIAKYVPSSSAWSPIPTSVTPVTPTPVQLANLTFSEPIQLTGNLTDPWEDEYHFGDSDSAEFVSDMDGDNVVFTRGLELFVYNVATNKLTRINASQSERILKARIWQDIVVYEQGANIYMSQVVDGNSPIAVTNDNVTERGHPNKTPDVHNGIIVWAHQDDVYRPYYIKMVEINDLSHPRRLTISDGKSEENPRIYNNIVVWQDGGGGEMQIHMCDLKNNDTPWYLCKAASLSGGDPTTPPKSYTTYPYIYKNKVVWLEKDESYANPAEIYMYELGVSNQKVKIVPWNWDASNYASYSAPLIYKDFVAYHRPTITYTYENVILNVANMKEYVYSVPKPFSKISLGGLENQPGFKIVYSEGLYSDLDIFLINVT